MIRCVLYCVRACSGVLQCVLQWVVQCVLCQYLQPDVEDGHGQVQAPGERLHVLQQHLLRVQA